MMSQLEFTRIVIIFPNFMEQKEEMISEADGGNETPGKLVDTQIVPPPQLGMNVSVPASIILAGVIIALAIVYSNGGIGGRTGGTQTAVTPPSTNPGDIVDTQSLMTGKDEVLGDPGAPVTVVEFADFQCPFCGKFFQETEAKIIDNYVKKGKVKFVYKHLAFLGQESTWAAEASECAGEQGKFWDYHDFIFNYMWNTYYGQGKSGENVGALSKENLKKFAKNMGLNAEQFNSCLDSEKYADKVAKDVEVARAHRITSTPSTYVNGKPVIGAQPYSQFSSLIDAALSGKK